MRTYVIVAAGILSSVALGATVFKEQVASAAQAILPVQVVNDATQPVPVHEQGTANVNVTNTVPVGGTVSATPPSQRVIRVATDLAVPANFARHTGFRDTGDCRALAAFVDADFGLDDNDVSLWMSPTGSLSDAVSVAYTHEGTAVRVQQAWYFSAGDAGPVFAPTAEVVVVNRTDSDGTINGAWLICSR
jgi:hypothetical protein